MLNDIRHRAKRVLEDEDRVRQELMDSKAKQGAQQMKANKSTIKATEKRLADTAQDERDIEQYLQSIKKYVAIEQLDREMLLELIKYIEIGERKVVNGQKCRDIVIHYNLVDKAG